MKIMVMNIPGNGHVNPTLPIVQELVKQGVQVLYYNDETFRAKIAATGAEFRAYPPTRMTPATIAQGVTNHLIEITLLLFQVSLTLTEFMLHEIAREAPDLLIFDSICLWGMQAARISQVPAVASITTFVQEGIKVRTTWRDQAHLVGAALVRLPKLLRARRALIQRYGRESLPKQHIFPATGQLNLVYTTRELQPPTPFIDDTFHFVGPSLALPNGDSTLTLPEGRIIYISLGTIHTNLRFLKTCFAALADLPAAVVLSAGALADQLTAPANFIVRAQVPQLEVLQRADLFITHAGINSLHESLYFGVPMVMTPQQMEQMMNARIAEMHGLGVVIGDRPPYGQQVSAPMLRAAVDAVLANPAYRAASANMQRLLQATNGTAEAVRLILEFGRGG